MDGTCLCGLEPQWSRRCARRQTGVRISRVDVRYVRYIRYVPQWFSCKQLKNVLARAMHALDAGISLSDLAAEDSPLVWLSQGFTRINGYDREDAVGHNCRFLQADPSDPAAVHRMRSAIARSEHTRVHVWNEGMSGGGFWSLVSLQPALDEMITPGFSAPWSRANSLAASRCVISTDLP